MTTTTAFAVGSTVKLTKKLRERHLGSIGVVREIINPTVIVDWEQQLPGVLDYTEVPLEFLELVESHQSAPNLTSNNGFNYLKYFVDQDLALDAQNYNSRFLQFVGKTFTEIIKLGKELSLIKQRTTQQLGIKQGNRVFKEWLISSEFGGSRYLAQTALKLARWFGQLPTKTQKLVSTQVNKWSLRYLELLPRLSTKQVESMFKHYSTAKIKQSLQRSIRKRHLKLGQTADERDWDLVARTYDITGDSLETLKLEANHAATPDPDTGEIVVTSDNIITALKAFDYDPVQVLPKVKSKTMASVAAADEQLPQSVKTQQREPEQPRVYTQWDLDSRIEQALDDYKTATKEQELARMVEIREAALQQAKDEIKAAHQVKAAALAKQKQLQQQLAQLQSKIATVEQLEQANLEKERRIADLEKILDDTNQNSWQNNFTTQAAEVVNQELEQLYKPLLAKLEAKDEQIAQLQTQVEQLQCHENSLCDDQLYPGAKVKIIFCDRGLAGETAEVIEHNLGNGSWWLLLDCVKERGHSARSLYKASQLALVTETTENPEVTKLKAQNRQLLEKITRLRAQK